jgi:hypothetical protein
MRTIVELLSEKTIVAQKKHWFHIKEQFLKFMWISKESTIEHNLMLQYMFTVFNDFVSSNYPHVLVTVRLVMICIALV